jgi:hypothetical protein
VTPIAVLAEARAAGLVIRPDGENLHVQPAARLTPELRAKLVAVKPELLEMLKDARQAEIAAAWAASYARIRRCEWPGRDVIVRLRPAALRAMDALERDAEIASRSYRAGTGSAEAFSAALAQWEGAVRDTATELNGLCHDCGQQTAAAVADPTTGERFCARCLAGGRR